MFIFDLPRLCIGGVTALILVPVSAAPFAPSAPAVLVLLCYWNEVSSFCIKPASDLTWAIKSSFKIELVEMFGVSFSNPP